MTRTCTVCKHKQLEEINKQLVNGESYRSISRLFDVSEQAILRHKSNPISSLLSKSQEITDLAQADKLAHHLNAEYQDIKNIKQQALESGNHELALKAIDRSLKTIEIVVKVAALIREQKTNINNNNPVVFATFADMAKFAALEDRKDRESANSKIQYEESAIG